MTSSLMKNGILNIIPKRNEKVFLYCVHGKQHQTETVLLFFYFAHLSICELLTFLSISLLPFIYLFIALMLFVIESHYSQDADAIK